MNEVAQAELSPSSVAFLYAHRFAPAAKAGETGTVSLANDTVVQTTPLTRMLVILGLWSLQDGGVIALVPFKEKRLRFIPWTGVRARLLEPSKTGGIEGDVIAELVRDKKGRDPGMEVSTIVHFLYKDRRGKSTPEALVRKRVVEDVVERGYAERINKQLEGRKAQIEPIKPAADQLLEQWNTFCNRQTELRDELVTAVKDAFNAIQP
jgi:hypothetical protein